MLCLSLPCSCIVVYCNVPKHGDSPSKTAGTTDCYLASCKNALEIMVSWTSGIISSDESNMAMTITRRSIEECHLDYVEIREGRHAHSQEALRVPRLLIFVHWRMHLSHQQNSPWQARRRRNPTLPHGGSLSSSSSSSTARRLWGPRSRAPPRTGADGGG